MAASSADSSRPARKGRILIVDDEEGIRELLKAILEADAEGRQVIPALLAHWLDAIVSFYVAAFLLSHVLLPAASGH